MIIVSLYICFEILKLTYLSYTKLTPFPARYFGDDGAKDESSMMDMNQRRVCRSYAMRLYMKNYRKFN